MIQKIVHIDINTAMSICLRAGVKIYPIVVGRSFVIEVNDNGSIMRYEKQVSTNKVANAQSKVYKSYALKLKQKEYANVT